MIIPSNSPAKSFPGNTSSKFSIPLSKTLLTPTQEKWRVGLMKAQVPLTFYNIENEEDKIVAKLENGEESVSYLPEGVYNTPRDIIKKIENFVSLKWENGFRLKMWPNVREITLTTKLSKLLGFPSKLVNTEEWVVSGVRHFDPWINHRVLLIHCSLVRESQVGVNQYQILQSLVPVNFDFGQTLSREYFPLDYYEVLGNSHSVISFKITDVENHPVKFRTGNVVLTLHFKRDG